MSHARTSLAVVSDHSWPPKPQNAKSTMVLLSINQSINHLFVLNSTSTKVYTQYSVEQDTKAWSTYRCPKLSLIIKTHKKSSNVNNAAVNYSGDNFNDSKSTVFKEFLNAVILTALKTSYPVRNRKLFARALSALFHVLIFWLFGEAQRPSLWFCPTTPQTLVKLHPSLRCWLSKDTTEPVHRLYFKTQLASCLINAQPLPAHRPAADDNSLIGCTGHDLTDEWSLPVPISLTACVHFCTRLGAFFYRTRFTWQQFTVRIPLRFIWSICSEN